MKLSIKNVDSKKLLSALLNVVYVASAAVCLITLLYCLELFVRCFMFDYFKIPTHSMQPTLKPKDEVLVNKMIMGARIYTDFEFGTEGQELKSWRTKGLRRLKHNDVVVFNFPHHNGKINFVINNVYCKRIVALPGDSIYTENGFYKNNNYKGVLGVESEQQKFSQVPDSLLPIEIMNVYPCNDYFRETTTKNMHPIYVPRKGDVIRIDAHEAAIYFMELAWELNAEITWNWDTGEAFANGKPLKKHQFRHNYYFTVGDNVMNSYDSRYWGFVPEEYMVGVVTTVLRKDHHGWWRLTDFK